MTSEEAQRMKYFYQYQIISSSQNVRNETFISSFLEGRDKLAEQGVTETIAWKCSTSTLVKGC